MPKPYSYTPKPAEVHAGNLTELKKRIKSGEVSGSYIFYGEEEYTKNFYYKELVKVCGDAKLNVKTIYGNDFTLADFINACDTSPAMTMDMFSALPDEEDEYAVGDDSKGTRLVRLISPKLEVLTKQDEKYFLSKVENPGDGVIIVFFLYADEEEKLGKGLYKSIANVSLPINFKHEANGSNSLQSWILRHFNRAQIEVPRHVAAYLNNYVGNDMTTLKNEIDNCIDYLKFEERTELTAEDVENICKKSTSAQIFDISSNALKGNFKTAMAAYKVFKTSGEEPLLVFGTLAKAVNDLCITDKLLKSGKSMAEIAKMSGLRDFVVKNYVGIIKDRDKSFTGGDSYAKYISRICLEYDTRLKSSATNGYQLIEELIFKLAVAL